MSVRRILLTADTVGGVWTYAVDLAQALGEIGIETMLVTTGPPPGATQRAVVEAIDGVELIEIDAALDWLAPDAAAIADAGRRISDIAARYDVDVVQLNAPALAADVRFGRPVVAVTHSCLATWWDAVERGELPEDFRWRAALTHKGMLAADAVVAPSHAFAAATQRVHRLPVAPLVVANGRALPAVAAKRTVRSGHAFTAGRLWDRGKNIATLDAAAALGAPILAAGPLAGPGGDGVTVEYLDCLGTLDAAAVGTRLAARPIVVSAALYEPFGLAMLEAAQAGCALVLSDIPTFREIWEDAAVFVPPRDATGFAQAITGLLADPAERARYGAAAVQVAERYTVAAMRDGMAAVYAAVARRPAVRVAGARAAGARVAA